MLAGSSHTSSAHSDWLLRLAQLAESESPELRTFSPQQVVQQFGKSLRNELDFAVECRNATRIATQFEGYADADASQPRPGGGELLQAAPLIVVPRVHWQWSGERVCVQDYIVGIPGRKLAEVDAAGLDRKVLARRGARAVLKMIVQDGFFHADPHPGNIFYMPDGAIGVIDFGMVGRVTEQRRFQIVRLLHGLVVHDSAAVAEVLADWTEENNDIDEVRLQESADVFVDQYRGVPLKDLRMGAMLGDVTAMLREHGLSLPADLALMIKAFLTLEGMGRQLDPDFDMASEARPYLERAMLERFAPDVLVRRGRRTLSGLVDLLRDMPRDVHRLLQSARRGKLQMHIEVDTLRAFGEQVDRAANRLTMGIITAALVIGSSIVMNSVGGGVSNRWLMALGVLGFVGAALCGVWILFSIWRSGRR